MRIQILNFKDKTAAKWMWSEHRIKPGHIRVVRQIHHRKSRGVKIIHCYSILVMNYGDNNNNGKYTECAIFPDECEVTLNKKSFEKV